MLRCVVASAVVASAAAFAAPSAFVGMGLNTQVIAVAARLFGAPDLPRFVSQIRPKRKQWCYRECRGLRVDAKIVPALMWWWVQFCPGSGFVLLVHPPAYPQYLLHYW